MSQALIATSQWLNRGAACVRGTSQAYLAALEPTRREEAEQVDDARIVASACELCCDNLFQATEAAQARKKRDA